MQIIRPFVALSPLIFQDSATIWQIISAIPSAQRAEQKLGNREEAGMTREGRQGWVAKLGQ